MQLNQDALRTIVRHFTGGLVGFHSIQLALDPTSRRHAELYFSDRRALGLDKYVTEDEAVQRLETLLMTAPKQNGQDHPIEANS